jgi:hypothetical protein
VQELIECHGHGATVMVFPPLSPIAAGFARVCQAEGEGEWGSDGVGESGSGSENVPFTSSQRRLGAFRIGPQ